MNAKELRIKNIVLDKYFTNKPIVVESVSEKGINIGETFAGITYISYDKIEPIPLTEEWLKKLGLHYDKTTGRWVNNHCELTVNRSGNQMLEGYNWYYEGFEISTCIFVHQLQNLYFALTGEELI